MSEPMDTLLEQATRNVRISDRLFEQMGAAGVEWGEPDEEGFYTPTVYGPNAYEPLVKASEILRALVAKWDYGSLDAVGDREVWDEKAGLIAQARAALATVESSPEREGGE